MRFRFRFGLDELLRPELFCLLLFFSAGGAAGHQHSSLERGHMAALALQ